MAPAARVAFMKRFVLLNEPGKPAVTANPAGRPIVRCDTPAGAAEIQIGGADTRDNVAFLPVDLRDATDSSGASAIQVNMGLVRENGEWKILSLGLVLLDLPSLELEWDSAEADKNEQAAIASPIFKNRWRWAAGRSLQLLRFSNGKRIAPQVQRTRSECTAARPAPDSAT